MSFLHAAGQHVGKVEIEGRLVGQTLRAVMIEGPDGRRQWFPRRFVSIEEICPERVVVRMALWVAREKGYA